MINENNTIDYTLINNLFNTYNRTEEELLNLHQFITFKIPKNSIPPETMQTIFNNNNFKEDFKKLLIENLLRNPKEKTDKSFGPFCCLIYKNKLQNYFPELKDEEKFLNDLIFNLHYYNIALRIINLFSEEKIKSLDKSLLKALLYSNDSLDINSIIFLLKYLPEELDNFIKRYNDKKNKKALKKLIKRINIKNNSNNEIIKTMENSNILFFYIWKCKTFFDTNLDI